MNLSILYENLIIYSVSIQIIIIFKICIVRRPFNLEFLNYKNKSEELYLNHVKKIKTSNPNQTLKPNFHSKSSKTKAILSTYLIPLALGLTSFLLINKLNSSIQFKIQTSPKIKLLKPFSFGKLQIPTFPVPSP